MTFSSTVPESSRCTTTSSTLDIVRLFKILALPLCVCSDISLFHFGVPWGLMRLNNIMFIGYFYVLFCDVPVKNLAHFGIFFLLICRNFLHILDMSPLSDMCTTNIFFLYVSCLLNLLRYHLIHRSFTFKLGPIINIVLYG